MRMQREEDDNCERRFQAAISRQDLRRGTRFLRFVQIFISNPFIEPMHGLAMVEYNNRENRTALGGFLLLAIRERCDGEGRGRTRGSDGGDLAGGCADNIIFR
jgi:hypothetical protein